MLLIVATILLMQLATLESFMLSNRGWTLKTTKLSMLDKTSIMKETKYLSGVFGLVNMLVFASPAFASGPLEYINPKDAVLVTEAASSTDVKTGREGLQDLINKLDSLKSELEKNRQAEVSDRVQKDFRLDAVRETLNKFNGAFSEDTQRGSDRLIRLFLQDVTSLEREGQVKTGRERSEARTNSILKTLNKAESTLKELQSFYPK